MYVIVNDRGELYYGFESGRPVWKKSKRDGCELDEKIADQVVSQLKQLGFEKCVKRSASGVMRKWVPSDMDASAL